MWSNPTNDSHSKNELAIQGKNIIKRMNRGHISKITGSMGIHTFSFSRCSQSEFQNYYI